MVKFGGHVEAIRDGDLTNANLYLLPYNHMKSMIFEVRGKEEEKNDDGRDEFVQLWNQALDDAENDFRKARRDIWETMFAVVATHGDPHNREVAIRGAHPGNVLKLYADHVPDKTQAQELLVRMKEVYRSAEINSEGLRKIVKKYDKNKTTQLSAILLPSLYASNLYTGQKMIEESIGLLRELLDDQDGSGHFRPLIKNSSEFRHQESVENRMKEMEWLKNLVSSIPQEDLLPHLVAHRGFHHINDRNDKRPLENSLSAYEMAWTCGIHLCECDIAITKDEKLVLAHDENFQRLSLDNGSEISKRKVSDLTFRELISMPLLSGVRPPLLIDVLRSANAISEQSKLIIEVKPGNDTAAAALARLLIRHPDLRSNVAMIMSFDAATMHKLRRELAAAVLSDPDTALVATMRGYTSGTQLSSSPMNHHRRVTSYDHFGTLGGSFIGGGSSSFRQHHPSMDLGSIGLSISQTNLNGLSSTHAHPMNGHQHEDTTIPPTPAAEDIVSLAMEAKHMPKLMLLTVAHPPHKACELQVQYNELHRVDGWLAADDGSLDGVYLQYEEEMMTAEGAAYLRELSGRFLVGIWGYSGKDPDDFQTFEWLVKEGNCTFVNTDLPKHFRRDLPLL
ncbi:glycerophosphoryl diester phosphodiesterase [Nitzschia inconspicua]|uniref:Glycerophosphoryl diester phosphodiesterase n=1 Tax=Nitzschia inconspicua TaxID=303405 RepID=A0A9K3L4A1_9STRA|nr:glycerophosphoryl diester phosphodiesterase [Nitzschia inconspicua]